MQQSRNNSDQDRKIRNPVILHIVLTLILFLLFIVSIPFARAEYFEEDEGYIYVFLGFIFFIVLVGSLIVSGFTKMKLWYLTVASIVLLVLQCSTPRLSVKYGWGGVRGEYVNSSSDELSGAIERAESRYIDGRWDSPLDIFSLLKDRMPKGHPYIFEMKALLYRAGYYEGPINSIYSDEILKGLDDLKSYYNLPLNGKVEDAANTRKLVYNTQTILYALAYSKILGLNPQTKPAVPKIEAAVKAFQKKNKLHVDGDIGYETINKLKQRLNIKAGLH